MRQNPIKFICSIRSALIASFLTLTACGSDTKDTQAPSITLNGESPMVVAHESDFSDPGASANDNNDGSIAPSVSGSVDTNTLGSYTLTYHATDAAGNSASSERIVNVTDQTAPTITLEGDNTIIIAHGSTYADLGVVITDNIDNDLTAVVTGSVDTNTLGSYTLTYSATDAAGNSASSERIVNVTDQTAPTITLEGDSTIIIAHGSTYTDLGVVITDNIDNDLTAVVTGSVDTNTLGSYTLTYDATDASGNSGASVTRTIEVVKNTGKLAGTVISGMSYNTETQTGVTDALGQFHYLAGETISFSIGATQIGDTITAQQEITMLDLLPNTTLYTTFSQIYTLNNLNDNHPDRIAFFKFSNTLSLLESIDDDSNPDNGINIPSELLEMFSAVEIDLQQHIFYFAGTGRRWGNGDQKLKRILQPAATMGLINSGNITSYGIALDNYYRLNQIEHQFAVPSITKTDSDANGTVDEVEVETYDSQGNKISYTEDSDNDGNIDRSRTYTYNDNGQQLSVQYDDNGDGNLNSANYYIYDINGNKKIYQHDDNGDGTINGQSTYVYDSYGNNVSYSRDNDGDGTIDATQRYTYDDMSNQLAHIYDQDNDGVINNLDDYTYDAQGNILTSKSYTGDRVTLTSEYTYTYDERGNLLTFSNDSDVDGNIDSSTTRTYDSNNNLLTEESDHNGDNIIDNHSTRTYDVNGYIKTRVDVEVGVEERNYTYSHDDRGNRLSYHFTNNVDSEELRIYTFDNNGNEIKEEVDKGNDGSIDRIYIYGYDSNNNYISKHYDSDGDGTTDNITTITLVPSTIRAVLPHVF